MKLLDRDTSRVHFRRTEDLRKIPAGAHVAFKMTNGRPLAEAIWESWKAGHVIVPMDPRWPAAKTNFVLQHSEAEYLVTDFDGDEPGGDIKDLRGRPEDRHQPDMSRRIILYTSGSTGDPKGVMLSRKAVMDNCYGMSERFGFDHQTNVGTCLPLWHVNALYALISTQSVGCWFFIHPNADVEEYFEELGYWDVKVAFIVPSLTEKVLGTKPRWPKRLQYFVTAASALTQVQATRWADVYGARTLVQGYGSTEGGNFLFVMPKSVQVDASSWAMAVGEGSTPSVGVPLRSGYEYRIVLDGKVLPQGEVGEVQVRAKSMMSGYWKNPKATDEVMIGDGWLRTGDSGYVDSGRQLRLVGRSKELIKRSGVSFWPADVEEFWEDAGTPGVAFPVAASDGAETVGGAFGGESFHVCKVFDAPRRPTTSVTTSWGYSRGIDDDVYADHVDPSDLHSGVSIPTIPEEYVPDYFVIGDVERTSTGKPQRIKAGKSARVVTVPGYRSALAAAGKFAHACEARPLAPTCSRAAAVTRGASVVLAREVLDADAGYVWDQGVSEFYLRLAEHWRDSAESYDGVAFLKSHPGLWSAVMNGPLMGSYGELAAMIANDIMDASTAGEALELGTGTGNTSRHVRVPAGWRYVESDLDPSIVPSGKAIKVDVEAPIPGQWDLVVATNVLHCAADPIKSLENIHEALRPGGSIIVSEGNPRPGNVTHAIEILCSGLPGWFDRGGFRERAWWVLNLSKAGFSVRGWSKIRCGKFDIGGAIWARKV